MKYIVLIGLIVLGIIYYNMSLGKYKNITYSTVAKKVTTNTKVSNEKKNQTEIKQDEKIKITLEDIMDTTVKEPEATQIWEWLVANSFDHPKTLDVLEELFSANGHIKYYKNLLEILSNGTQLSSKVRSHIIMYVAGAFDGKNNKVFSKASNNKDIEIQNMILDELNNPADELSFEAALNASLCLAENKELQNILDDLLANDNGYINKNKILEMKIASASFSNDAEDLLSILSEVNAYDKNVQTKMMDEMLSENFLNAINQHNGELILENYKAFLNNNLPPKLKRFNRDKFEQHMADTFKFPDDVVTVEDRDKYYTDHIGILTEEEAIKALKSNQQYSQWFLAYANTLDESKRYDFYKEKILNAQNEQERQEIIYMIQDRAERGVSEYIEYNKKLNKEKILKKEKSI